MKFLCFLLIVASGSALADHDSGAPWSWHIVSGGLDESRIAIYRQQTLIGIYDFACDLTDVDDGEPEFANATLDLVQPASHPRGLFVVTCNVGAHSQHIAVIDPERKTHHPVFSKTGSYFAKWEIEDGELWLSYDRSCGAGPSVDCPDGFETVYERYPPVAATE